MTSEMLNIESQGQRNHSDELTKRVHQIFPDAEVKADAGERPERCQQSDRGNQLAGDV